MIFKACRGRLTEDFNEVTDFAEIELCNSTFNELAFADFALDASKSPLHIMTVEIDDDQNAYGFVSDGAHLRRK